MTTGLALSVQVRLVQHAKRLGIDPNVILARYACERLLYRLACSAHAERFVLKGAMLLIVWFDEMLRPTRDVDLLAFGEINENPRADRRGYRRRDCSMNAVDRVPKPALTAAASAQGVPARNCSCREAACNGGAWRG